MFPKTGRSDAMDSGAASATRRQRIKKRFQTIGQNLQKINLAKLIDQMEQDQELADRLEFINRESNQEMKRKAIVLEARERCQREIETHLDAFLISHPQASYEAWIQKLHPENVQPGKLLDDLCVVDERFYVETSDHRKLWNERVPSRHVSSRSVLPPLMDSSPFDLLDDTVDVLEEVDLSITE